MHLPDAQVDLWVLDGPHTGAIDVPNAGLCSNLALSTYLPHQGQLLQELLRLAGKVSCKDT